MSSDVKAGGATALLRDLRTIPNQLSLSRVFLSAGAIYGLLVDAPVWILWLSLASAVIDILDGLAARKLGQVTELGAILDRATDLMMESVALYALAACGWMPIWVFFVYLFREFIVTSARMYMAEIGAPIPESALGKRKTNFLMTGFGFGFNDVFHIVPLGPLVEVGAVLAWIGVVGGLVFSYLSMGKYLAAFARSYRGV